MEMAEKIAKVVGDVLNRTLDPVETMSGDEPLHTLGMDSINCVEIILQLEEEFNIAFEDEELMLDNLNSINKLCKIVKHKQVEHVA